MAKFGSEDVKVLTLTLDVDPTGEETFHLMKMPRAATIKAAYVVPEQSQNAGTAVTLALENWGTAGTAVEGTIAAAIGGTAAGSRLTALTPAAMTIDSDQDYLDAGDWLVLHYNEEGAGWISDDRFNVIVQYVDGLGA